jgi:hypothetical protein
MSTVAQWQRAIHDNFCKITSFVVLPPGRAELPLSPFIGLESAPRPPLHTRFAQNVIRLLVGSPGDDLE